MMTFLLFHLCNSLTSLQQEAFNLKYNRCTKSQARVKFQGWTICIEKEVPEKTKENIQGLLQSELYYIETVLPRKAVRFLKKTAITIKSHPYRGCKKSCHSSTKNSSRIFITDPAYWIGSKRQEVPATLLHELAHVWHIRVLGHDHVAIRKLYEDAKQDERYLFGPYMQHQEYMMKNEREFFAMLSECWFWHSANAPFNRVFLKAYDSEAVEVLERLWDVDPRRMKQEI